MLFLTQGKTNWKYILILVILAVIVGGGILWWMKKEEISPPEFPKIEKPEEIIEEQELAEETVKGYVEALMSRQRDNVLPYLTGEAKTKVQAWPPSFGTSNPHLGNFEILSTKKLDTTKFEFVVREYQEYTGEGIIGYNDETLTVIKVNDKYLISSAETGEYVDIKETVDWKTYRNEEYGFEIKYPEDWVVRERQPGDKLINLIMTLDPSSLLPLTGGYPTLFEIGRGPVYIREGEDPLGRDGEPTTIGVDNIPAFVRKMKCADEDSSCGLYKGEKIRKIIYTIDLKGTAGYHEERSELSNILNIIISLHPEQVKYVEVANQILSTFRFLE